ncbi:MAG: DNA polymerase domain-containing protein, partial [Nanopusillaceae archaeon]
MNKPPKDKKKISRSKNMISKDTVIDNTVNNSTSITPKSIRLDDLKLTYINNKSNNIDCMRCPLRNNPIVTFDSNLQSFNPGDIDVLFVAEAPGATEVEKGIPLIGRSGQIIRSYIDKFLQGYNWFMTNVCLCRPDNNATPTKHEIQSCFLKLDEIIDIVKPKLIIAMGNTAMERFNIQGSVTKSRGIHSYKNISVYLTLHPSAILRSNKYDVYEEDFSNIRDILDSNRIYNNENSNVVNIVENINTDKLVDYSVKIPNQYYKYSLLDVQQTPDYDILYIFRDPEGKRIYYKSKFTYYYYVKDGKGQHIEPIKDLMYVTGKPKYGTTSNYETYYESDISNDMKCCIDYYFNKTEDNIIVPKIMYLDIEVLSDGSFPKPEEANFPVVLVTFKDNDSKVTYSLSDPIEDDRLKDKNIIYFKDEKELLLETARKISTSDIDIVTAWNVYFDIPYIYQRMKRLGLDTRLLSPLGYEPEIDFNRETIDIAGLVVVDLLEGYKHLVENKKESYSLDFIANDELGEGKSHKGSAFNILWEEDRAEAISYNINDVDLIYEIDKKLDILGYLNELRNTASIPWKYINFTSKIVDSLLIRFMKERQMAVRSKLQEVSQYNESTKYGAYVYEPIPGLHDNVYEVDFSKQYPSTIQTLNIGTNTFFAVLKDRDDIREIAKKNRSKTYKVILNPVYQPTLVEYTYDQIKDFVKKNNLILSLAGGFFVNHKSEKSNLYDLIDYLNTSRNKYKKLYKETLNPVYDNKQRAFKIITNSVYGYLGLETGRMYNSYLVNNVTLTGRYVNKLCALSINKLLTDG